MMIYHGRIRKKSPNKQIQGFDHPPGKIDMELEHHPEMKRKIYMNQTSMVRGIEPLVFGSVYHWLHGFRHFPWVTS